MIIMMMMMMMFYFRKKKGGSKEVEEVKPEEMALQIGGTILSEGRRGMDP